MGRDNARRTSTTSIVDKVTAKYSKRSRHRRADLFLSAYFSRALFGNLYFHLSFKCGVTFLLRQIMIYILSVSRKNTIPRFFRIFLSE